MPPSVQVSHQYPHLFLSLCSYQQGPDTYLLQLRDTGLPSRLREYIKVAADRSHTFAQRALDEPMYDRTVSSSLPYPLDLICGCLLS